MVELSVLNGYCTIQVWRRKKKLVIDRNHLPRLEFNQDEWENWGNVLVECECWYSELGKHEWILGPSPVDGTIQVGRMEWQKENMTDYWVQLSRVLHGLPPVAMGSVVMVKGPRQKVLQIKRGPFNKHRRLQTDQPKICEVTEERKKKLWSMVVDTLTQKGLIPLPEWQLPVIHGCSTIQLYKKPSDKKPVLNTLIDSDNFIKLNKYRWLVITDHITGCFHAARYVLEDGHLELIYMANEVLRIAGFSRFRNTLRKKRSGNKRKRPMR
jgi:hypothetical protein